MLLPLLAILVGVGAAVAARRYGPAVAVATGVVAFIVVALVLRVVISSAA